MSDLDDVVQTILLEGDREVLDKLQRVGEDGARAIEKLAAACAAGATPMEALSGAIGIIGAALVGAAAGLSAFVISQDDAIQKTNFLAEAFGATTAEIAGIEAAFAAAGVSTTTFETFAQRLTVTIAREWPAITEAVRTSATAQEAAQEQIKAAMLRVQDAQNHLATVSEEQASKIANANLRVQESMTALQFASQRAFATMQQNINSVQGATLGLEAAEQRLAALQGRPVSESEKKALEIKQAQLAVDQAQQALSDAETKKQQAAAEAVTKRTQQEQALTDAQQRRETAELEATTARQKAELQVKEAITQRAEVAEKESQRALKDLPAIANALDGVANKNKEVASSIDLANVKIEDLKKGIILAASAGNGQEPSGLKTMIELSKILSNSTDDLINHQQRLALVQALGQRSLSQTGAAAFELLSALERGPEYFKNFTAAAEKSFSASAQGKENVKNLKDAYELLSFTVQQTNRDLAALASPALTAFFTVIQESLSSSNGLLHQFVDGIKFISAVVSDTISGFKSLFDWIDKAFNLEKGTSFKALLLVIIGVVAAFAAPWLAIPAAIALIVVALGELYEKCGSLKDIVGKLWEAFKDTSVFRFLERAIGLIETLYEKWKKYREESDRTKQQASLQAAGPGQSPSQEQGLKLASGGEVHGPGSTTSDSILARLSRGEFVMKAQAVQTYGAGLFHQLNNMTFPGFAAGGMVPSPVRFAGGGVVPASSTLNLSIDGQTFSGLKGPKNVVDSLAAFAVGRQTASTGRQPSWNH
jgi:hypothetical protein